jgi:hypothetical protein
VVDSLLGEGILSGCLGRSEHPRGIQERTENSCWALFFTFGAGLNSFRRWERTDVMSKPTIGSPGLNWVVGPHHYG